MECERTRKFCNKIPGAKILAVVGHYMQAPGWPDRFISHSQLDRGGIWVEFKNGDNQLSKLQRRVCCDLLREVIML